MKTIVERLRKALAAKAVERVSQGWPAYRQLLEEMANGKDDHDPVEVELILQSVDKTIADVDGDLDRLEKRLELGKQVTAGKSAEKSLGKARQRLESLSNELQEAKARLEPAILEQGQKIRQLEDSQSTGSIASDELWRSCMDPSLLAKAAELQRELTDRLRERQALADLLSDSRLGSIQSSLGAAEGHLEEWTRRCKDSYNRDPYDCKQRDYWQAIVDNVSRRQASSQELLDEIDKDLDRIRSEQDAIRKLMEAP